MNEPVVYQMSLSGLGCVPNFLWIVWELIPTLHKNELIPCGCPFTRTWLRWMSIQMEMVPTAGPFRVSWFWMDLNDSKRSAQSSGTDNESWRSASATTIDDFLKKSSSAQPRIHQHRYPGGLGTAIRGTHPPRTRYLPGLQPCQQPMPHRKSKKSLKKVRKISKMGSILKIHML